MPKNFPGTGLYIIVIKVGGTSINGLCVDRKAHTRLVMPHTQLAQVGRCLVEILSHNKNPRCMHTLNNHDALGGLKVLCQVPSTCKKSP